MNTDIDVHVSSGSEIDIWIDNVYIHIEYRHRHRY